MIERQTVSKTAHLTDIRIIQRILWISIFTALTIIGANIEIPNQPVPFTLQTLFVLLAGVMLNKNDGSVSMGLYIILGAIGLPVFSGGTLGIARIFGPTGGYILSFPIAAYVIGYLVRLRTEYWWMVFSLVIGSLVILCIGTIQLNLFFIHNWVQSFQMGFLIFSWWDAVKIIAAASIAYSYFQKFDSNKRIK